MSSTNPPDPADGLGPMDFSTFVISLGSNALLHLGGTEAEEADSGPAQLELARQTIDILAMLQDKTTGNLTEDEGELLTSVLYRLRISFVDASGADS